MPVTAGEYEVRKNDDGSFSVVNTTTGKVHSSHSSEDDAKHQKQLLYAVGHGWKPSHDHSTAEPGVQRGGDLCLTPIPGTSTTTQRVSTPQARSR